MSEWLDPTGRSTYGIGLCDRCHEKFPLEELHPDPNSPGLRVCLADLDVFDPYRLPARQTEDIALPFTRPDSPLTDDDGDSAETVLALATQNVNNLILTEDSEPLLLEGLI